MPDIIICEDNKEIGELLSAFLKKENYTVAIAPTGERALELFDKYGAKLMVLDIMLPGIDGFAVCSKIRETSNTHIIIASAKSDKDSKLEGLALGADDYIEKPYDIDILLAKIKGVFKRKYAVEEIIDGDLRLNTVQHTLTVGGKPVVAYSDSRDVSSYIHDGVIVDKAGLMAAISDMKEVNDPAPHFSASVSSGICLTVPATGLVIYEMS